MIRSRFQGMYWQAHKTATLTSFQHTVQGGGSRYVGAPCQEVRVDLRIQKREQNNKSYSFGYKE